MAKKQENPAAGFTGDFRLVWEQTVFINEFIKQVKRHASGVVASMRDELELTGDERSLDPSELSWAFNEWVCQDEDPDDLFEAGSTTASALRLLTTKLWPWAAGHGLVEPIASLRELDSTARQDGLDPELRYHRAMLLSIFEALKAWGGRKGPQDDSVWSVPGREGLPFSVAAGLDDPEAGGEFLRRGDTPTSLVTESGGGGLQYHLDLRVPAWDPLRQTEAAARRAILASVEALLETKFAAVREAMRGASDAAVSPSYFDATHFAWLVKFQVLGRPYQQVQEEDENAPSITTVYNGVASAARYLVGPGYQRWLRKSPRGYHGRRRKSDADSSGGE